jgi:hypothetical protein
MLALVASIHAWTRPSTSEDVDGADKPDHDGSDAITGPGSSPLDAPQ